MNKIDLAKKEIQEVLKKHNVKIEPKIDFPQYKKLPDDILLALNVLNKHEMKIIFSLALK